MSKVQKISVLLIFLLVIFNGTILQYKNEKHKEYVKYQLNLYNESKECILGLDDEVNLDEIDVCNVKVNLLDDEEIKKELNIELDKITDYARLGLYIDNLYIDDILNDETSTIDIKYIDDSIKNIDDRYRDVLNNKFEKILSDYSDMIYIVNEVDKLIDTNIGIVNTKATRKEYLNAKNKVDSLKQVNLKNKLNANLNEVNNYITKIENESIAKSWIKISIPYISQNKSKVYNGCEAASLLMILQYKGYLLTTNLKTFATNMPKSDNPNDGFVLDIFGVNPTNRPHWISPMALSKYGNAMIMNSNVIDATGISIDEIITSIENGNPVIAYVTYDLYKPIYNIYDEVPNNLHVLVITGYNYKTNQFELTDPWTRSNGTYKLIVSRSKLENVYNAVGKKCVIVK